MNTDPQSVSRTRSFARVIGPCLTIVSVIATARSAAMATLLTQFTSGELWSWVVGAFALIGGIAIVAFHQYWRSPAAVIVSVIGWLLVVRGVLLMAFPGWVASVADRIAGSVGSWQVVYVAVASVGLYLTYVGWMARAGAGSGNSAGASGEHGRLHRAA